MRPDEVTEQIPLLSVPDEPGYETVGGFIMAELGRIPSPGDRVPVSEGVLEVERMDGRRIDRVRFSPAPPDEEPGDARPGTQDAGTGAHRARTGAHAVSEGGTR
jgi:CBS domain containing-hemolysin-like protein